jgi:hypothetical protein
MSSERTLPAIEQTLHGYREGHRMLASSTRIEASVDRRMLQTLSDSPDANRIDPDSPLLCGYPLPSGDFYVIAMTWPAPDVRRPGCVWTHSLLLDEDALSVDDLTPLLGAFRRPGVEQSFKAYAAPLLSVGHDRSPGVADEPIPGVSETLLWSLFDPPAPPVEMRLRALEEADPRRFLIRIFSQLWPALRANFSFAIAPRTARRIDGKLMDLQITSQPQAGSWEQPQGEPKVRTVTKPLARGGPDWCAALTADLARPGGLRKFFRAGAGDVPATRSSMWALACVWAGLAPDYPFSGYDLALQAVIDAFPHAAEATMLKQALLTGACTRLLPFKVEPAAVIVAVAKTGLPAYVATDSQSLANRASELAGENEDAAREVCRRLLAGRVSEAGVEILTGVSQALSERQIRSWAEDDPQLLAALAGRAPVLAARPELWEAMPLELLWPTLGRPRIARARRVAMLQAILGARALNAARAVASDWPDGEELLIDALAHVRDVAYRNELLGFLQHTSVIEWMRLNGPSAALAEAVLAGWKPKQLAKVPASEWNALLEAGGKLSDYTLALLLVASSDPRSELGPRRAAAAFGELSGRVRSGASLSKRANKVLREACGQSAGVGDEALAAFLLGRGFLSGAWNAAALLDLDDHDLRIVLQNEPSGALAESVMGTLQHTKASRAQREVVLQSLLASKDSDILTRALKRVWGLVQWR